MKTPIIIIEELSSVMLFLSVQAAEEYMEAIDVNDGIYQGYDAEGHPLKVSTCAVMEENPWWLGGPAKREYVKITDMPQEKARVDELKDILKRYYRRLAQNKPEQFPIKVDDQMELKELIDIAEEYNLFYPAP